MSADTPDPTPSPLRADLVRALLLSTGWLAALGLIGAAGEFPVNDDWAYTETTRILLQEGRFAPPDWVYAPVVTNVLIGALFGSVLDWSFEALRLSGVCLGWLGMLATYALCRAVGATANASLLGAAVVGFNPVYVNLSYSFMTDVPFTALCTASLLLLFAAASRHSRAAGLAGLGVALLAVLSRQPGAALLAAAAVAALIARPRPTLEALLAAGLVAAVVVGLLLGPAPVVRLGEGALSSAARGFASGVLAAPVDRGAVAGNTLASMVYLGWFAAPAVALLLPDLRARAPRWLWGAAGSAVLIASALAGAGLRMPLIRNVIYDFGLGAPSLSGTLALPGAPPWLWWSVTALGVAAACTGLAALAEAAWRHRRRARMQPGFALLAAFPLLYVLPLLGAENFFDRYLLPMLPPLVALLIALARRIPGAWPAGAALALWLPLAVYGVVGTRDYLEHHRARWTLITDLLEQGVKPGQINGGFEFAGWFKSRPGRYLVSGELREEYVLSLATVRRTPRYELIDGQPYRRWLPPRVEAVSLFRRLPEGGDEGGGEAGDGGPEGALEP